MIVEVMIFFFLFFLQNGHGETKNLTRFCLNDRFKQKPPLPWLGITTSIGALVIALLIGYIFHATVNRIVKVEDDYREMMELKKRAEAADVAKSQVLDLIFTLRLL